MTWEWLWSLVIPVLGFGAKWAIDYWKNSKIEVEKYKSKQAQYILDDLADQLKSLKSKIATENQKTQDQLKGLRKEIAEHKALIMEQKGQIDTVMKVFEGTLESARRISAELDKKVDNRIKTEITRIRDMIIVGQKKLKEDRNGN